jgi:predicted transcriptional regulator
MNIVADLKPNLLVSVRPEFASKIANGEKTVELRRRFPRDMVIGARVLIYSSRPVAAIICQAKIKTSCETAVT